MKDLRSLVAAAPRSLVDSTYRFGFKTWMLICARSHFSCFQVLPTLVCHCFSCDSQSELEIPAARMSSGNQQPKRRRVAHKASEAASFAQPPLSSNTAMFLAYKWDCGEYSAQKVQRIAALVKADILTAIESSFGCSVQNEKKKRNVRLCRFGCTCTVGIERPLP